MHLRTVDTLVDIGGGKHPQDLVKVRGTHGIIDPTIEWNHREGGIVFIKGDWKYANQLKFNNAFLIGVIEHLEKKEALRLLDETESYAKQIVVFTPLGFLEQNDGVWNTHRSGWYPQDFGKGWDVFVFPNYHYCDHKGNTYPEPHGAILAIFTIKAAESP